MAGSANFTIDVNKESLGLMEKMFAEFPQAADSILRDFAITIRRMLQGRTPVGRKYVRKSDRKSKKSKAYPPSGALKASWQGPTKEGNSWTVYTGLPYAYVLEEGRYPGIGKIPAGADWSNPRTVSAAGGIYSSQAPGGMAGPMLADQESPLGGGLTLEAALQQLEARLLARLGV
jgi:hypothetical protein